MNKRISDKCFEFGVVVVAVPYPLCLHLTFCASKTDHNFTCCSFCNL